MDKTLRGSTKLHPAILVAAISVTLLSLAGVAALAGWLPSQSAATPNPPAVVATVGPESAPSADPAPRSAPPPGATPRCANCGTIENIRQVTRQGQGTGAGAVAGGVVGGALGNAIGKGDGRALATIAGAVGGGLIGNQIEKNQRQWVAYQVTVRLDDGRTKVLEKRELPPWRIGDKVKLEGGAITPL